MTAQNTFKFSKRSVNNLKGVVPPLVLIVSRALAYSEVDFAVTSGVRTVEEQRALVAAGKSKLLDSYHLYGKAVDLAAYIDGKLSWDWKYYEKLNEAMQKAADELGFKIKWGGSWRTFKDGAHWQLEEA